MAGDKVKIVVTAGHEFTDGGAFTSVDMSGSTYGGASPCRTEEEVESSIKHYKGWVRREGDTPAVVDERKKITLSEFF